MMAGHDGSHEPPLTMLVVAAALVLICPRQGFTQFYPAWRSPPKEFDPDDHSRYSVGGFVSLGLQSLNASPSDPLNAVAGAGLYVERNRNHLHAGFALRGVGSANGTVNGTLAGPRFSYSYHVLHPYVEGLFGPNHLTLSGVDRQGVTSAIAFGLEIAYARNVRWRVIEFTQGTFTGQPDSHPRSFSTGFVVRVP